MSDIRMRQICLVAHDLDRIQKQIESVFGVEVCFRDPGVGRHGLHNMLLPFGNQLLETVSPKPGEHDTAGGRYLQRRGGDGGYMVIMQVPRAAYSSYRARVDEMGIRLVAEPGEGEKGVGIQLHPKDLPGGIQELRWNEDEARDDGAWWPAGENWQRAKRTEIVDGIRAAEIQTEDPAALAGRWSEVLDEPVGTDVAGNPCVALSDAEVRFVPVRDGRGEGLAGLDIQATDANRALANAEAIGCRTGEDLITICGMRLRLV
ncbi:MAG TPA: VOC family protein [Dehalococcoidia bacterium]|nr:VOC family protein [Dehalococcoidia bacterium]